MELRHLRYFVATAETGAVSRAAQMLRLSQPSLSRQIKDLEADLGVSLFQRVGRGLRITEDGRQLLAYAQRVLNQAEALRDRARALNAGEAGVLRVGATPQTLERLFPKLLRRFSSLRPGVDVHLTEGDTRGLLDQVSNGDLHLAMTAYRPESALDARLLGVSPLIAVGTPTTLPETERLEVSDLADLPLLLLRKGFGSRDLFDAACGVAHLETRPFLESSAADTLLALAAAELGIAVLPATVDVYDSNLEVRRLFHGGVALQNEFAVHWDPLRFLPPYAALFLEELVACATIEYSGLETGPFPNPGPG